MRDEEEGRAEDKIQTQPKGNTLKRQIVMLPLGVRSGTAKIISPNAEERKTAVRGGRIHYRLWPVYHSVLDIILIGKRAWR